MNIQNLKIITNFIGRVFNGYDYEADISDVEEFTATVEIKFANKKFDISFSVAKDGLLFLSKSESYVEATDKNFIMELLGR